MHRFGKMLFHCRTAMIAGGNRPSLTEARAETWRRIYGHRAIDSKQYLAENFIFDTPLCRFGTISMPQARAAEFFHIYKADHLSAKDFHLCRFLL